VEILKGRGFDQWLIIAFTYVNQVWPSICWNLKIIKTSKCQNLKIVIHGVKVPKTQKIIHSTFGCQGRHHLMIPELGSPTFVWKVKTSVGWFTFVFKEWLVSILTRVSKHKYVQVLNNFCFLNFYIHLSFQMSLKKRNCWFSS
jgi:hypothetical protein